MKILLYLKNHYFLNIVYFTLLVLITGNSLNAIIYFTIRLFSLSICIFLSLKHHTYSRTPFMTQFKFYYSQRQMFNFLKMPFVLANVGLFCFLSFSFQFCNTSSFGFGNSIFALVYFITRNSYQ